LYPNPDDFFADHYAVNYCPLVWMEESGKNRTPDKISASEMEPVLTACDEYVKAHLEAFQPEFAIGVGAYAETCLRRISSAAGLNPTIGRILHPSPASPAANRDWAGTAGKQMKELGI
jgi:single-strand selective monofunctional uracil DNA glycosylase